MPGATSKGVRILLYLLLGGVLTSCQKATEPAPWFEATTPPSEIENPSPEYDQSHRIGSHTQTELEFAEPGFQADGAGNLIPASQWMQTLAHPESPLFLAKQYAFEKKSEEVISAWLSGLVVEKSRSRVNLAEGGAALSWSAIPPLKVTEARFFPGKWIRTRHSAFKTHVTVFPFQIDRQTGEVYLLRSAKLNLLRALGLVEVNAPEPGEALVVTSRDLAAAGEKLVRFQRERLGVESRLVILEDIDRGESLALDQYPDGYKNPEAFGPIVKSTYRFDRARQLAKFLHDRLYPGAPLRYITLLGDSLRVPPSYYFSTPAAFGLDYGVTDQCYGSVQRCLEPRAAVGRLPFSSVRELDNYLSKVEVWLTSAGYTNELSLYGGKAFDHSELFLGEFTALGTLQDPEADWRGVRKRFRTDASFSRKEVLELAGGKDPSRLVYYVDHGDGNRWDQDRETVSAKEILNASRDGASVFPLVVSTACSNGGFDPELTAEDIFPEPEEFGNLSVGQALLKSRAGAVGYLGVSRLGHGSLEFSVDSLGNVEPLGPTLNVQIFQKFMENYRRARHGRAGDLLTQSLYQFAFENAADTGEAGFARAYWITSYLGDPTLPLPVRPVAPTGALATRLLAQITDAFFNLSLLARPVAIQASLFKIQKSPSGKFISERLVKREKLAAEQARLQVEVPLGEGSAGDYLVRLANEDAVGRERQVLLKKP